MDTESTKTKYCAMTDTVAENTKNYLRMLANFTFYGCH